MTDLPIWLVAAGLLALPATGWFAHAGWVQRRHGRRIRILVQRSRDSGRRAGEAWARRTLSVTVGPTRTEPPDDVPAGVLGTPPRDRSRP